MKRLKKSILMATVFVLAMHLGACGNKNQSENDDANNDAYGTTSSDTRESNDDVADNSIQQGQPTSFAAKAVGAYVQIGDTCSNGSSWHDYAMFLCPGGRINGGGKMDDITNILCGSYTAAPPAYSDCDDKIGCYPKISATVKDTLGKAGITDVNTSFKFDMVMVSSDYGDTIWRRAPCDNEANGYIILERIASDVDDYHCESSSCATSQNSDGGYGACNADCDCGKCWYCEKGTCYYGGEGAYGCYRGCSG
ncbi:MAG: hypothetical protein JW841_08155 [Deltaproteobacteria bacterium]|nr:hypothetical protein [Deltaproteobacteria bacterium]